MLKCARNLSGSYASQFDDALVQGSNLRYLPKPKPAAMGVYEVERKVAKRFQGVKAEYLIKWKNYFPEENTWELVDYLPEELITTFESRSIDPRR